jgi:hypothetical protein
MLVLVKRGLILEMLGYDAATVAAEQEHSTLFQHGGPKVVVHHLAAVGQMSLVESIHLPRGVFRRPLFFVKLDANFALKIILLLLLSCDPSAG